MCRVAGLCGTPDSWGSGSGREKLGGGWEGKEEGEGRGHPHRGIHREMGRQRQGKRETERDRNTERLGDSAHTLRGRSVCKGGGVGGRRK